MDEHDLDARLRRLEQCEDAEDLIHAAGFLCDAGPYPPEELSQMWAVDGYYDTGGAQLRGREALYAFYDSLAAQYTIHFFTNPLLEPLEGSDVTLAHCYCFEAPNLDQAAHFGTFQHDIRIRTDGARREWLERRQQISFLVPFDSGWGPTEAVADQYKPE